MSIKANVNRARKANEKLLSEAERICNSEQPRLIRRARLLYAKTVEYWTLRQILRSGVTQLESEKILPRLNPPNKALVVDYLAKMAIKEKKAWVFSPAVLSEWLSRPREGRKP